MSIPEPAGLYAVVRAWWAPAHHLAAPAEQITYIKGPSGWDDGTTYWYVLGSEAGYSWEQVCQIAVRVEVVREGMEPSRGLAGGEASPRS